MTDTNNTPRKVHVMHDIETWAVKSARPVLLSLGAVKFNGDEIVDRFHVRIDPVDCQRYGLEIEAGTVDWWMDEARAAARAQLLAMGKNDLFTVLDGFAMWVRDTPVDQRGSGWSCGSNFDLTKLKAIYQKIGSGQNLLEWPFAYWQEECYRTMKNRFRDVKMKRLGIHHGALDDAESPAQHLIEMHAAHGIGL